MKLCKSCAKEVKNSATMCPYCGASFLNKKSVIREDEIEREKDYQSTNENGPYMNNGLIRGPFNKWISIVLCLLLGFLGAHKFYERKYITGIFYAVTFGFWGVGIIVDLIKLFSKPKYYYVSSIPFII